MLLKCHLGIKCHSQYNKVIRLLNTVPPIDNAGDWGCIVRDLETIVAILMGKKCCVTCVLNRFNRQ